MLKRTPVSDLPGEQTSPFQPVPLGDLALLSVLNTRKLKGAVWGDWGFFEPPSVNYKVGLIGLHGGPNWPGFSADNNGNSYVAISKDITLLELKTDNLVDRTSKVPPSLVRCTGCHDGINCLI